MTDSSAERIVDLTAQVVVDNVLCRTKALPINSKEVRETGLFESRDPVTGEIVTANFDDEATLVEVGVKLIDPYRLLVFDADGGVVMESVIIRRRHIFSGGEIDPKLSPRERRWAVGSIATAGALVEDLIDASSREKVEEAIEQER